MAARNVPLQPERRGREKNLEKQKKGNISNFIIYVDTNDLNVRNAKQTKQYMASIVDFIIANKPDSNIILPTILPPLQNKHLPMIHQIKKLLA